MADSRTIKKNLLQDLMQRARSSTQVGGPRFLSSHNSPLKGNRPSLKSPKLKSTRQSSKRLHLPSVFRSHKDSTSTSSTSTTEESKTDSLKENARRSGAGKSKTPKSYSEEEKVQISVPNTFSPVFQPERDLEPGEKRDKTFEEKVLQALIEKHTPQKEKLRSPKRDTLETRQHVQDHNLKSKKQTTVIPWKRNKSIPTSPGQNITTKLSYCNSCGHVEKKSEIKNQTVEKTALESGAKKKTASEKIKICQAEKTVKIAPNFNEKQRLIATKIPEVVKTHRKLVRSFSDPLSSPGKDKKTRTLYNQGQKVKEAKITQTQTLQRRNYTRRRYTDTKTTENCNEQTTADLKQWKNQIRSNTPLFSDSGSAVSTEFLIKSTMHKSGNIEDFYPLLKTKIPEEHIQEDGSVTLRKGGAEGVEKSDADRDSGVEVDNTCKTFYRLSSNDSEIDNDTELTVTPDSVLESAGENETQEFDFGTLKKSQKDTIAAEGLEETKEDTSTLTRRTKYLVEERTAWDMYALLRRFECIEWELTPASNLKRQTLDLDNCDLDSVPAAVTEIEYYAFRDVEAVSLNHNGKIENADVLGKLADLRVINMWGCNLKSIPQTWSRLTKLQMLGLGNNKQLSNFGPLKHLTNVVWLDLGGCGLKQIPDEVTNMMKLKVLALGGNQGIEIGDEICSMWDLKKLGLNDCELEEIPKSVFSLTKLTHLHLDNNYITHINQEIVQLTELEELTVTGNFDISFPKILSQCDTIRCIVVDESKDLTRVSGTLKNRMRSMPTAISPVREPPPKPRHSSIS